MTLTGLAGPLLVYFDRLAIGAWMGAAAGFYVIGYNLIARLQTVPGAFARAILLRLAELDGNDSLGRSNDAMRVMIALVTKITFAAMRRLPMPEEWLDALTLLIDSEEERRAKGANARRVAVEHYSRQAVRDQYREVLATTLDASALPRQGTATK